jgi:hypothetical protein
MVWLQFCSSGFFFREKEGILIQGASRCWTPDDEMRWTLCSAKPAEYYYTNFPDFFRVISDDVLDRIPEEMYGAEDYSYSLEIIADVN